MYSGTFYSHIIVCFFLLVSLHLILKEKNYIVAGLFSGAAFMSEYLMALFVAIWFFQIWGSKSFKESFKFGLGILPFVLIFLIYNYATTGSLTQTLYTYHVYYEMDNAGFTWPQIEAIWHMIFTPFRGSLIYMPVLVNSCN